MEQTSLALTGALQSSYQSVVAGLVTVLPKLITAILIFIAGWVFAALVERLVVQIVRAVKVDRALAAMKIDQVVSRAGFRLDAGKFLGLLIRWLIIVVFLVASLSIMGLNEVTSFLTKIATTFLPNAISAVLIILAAALIAEAAQKAIVGAGKAAGVKTSNLLGTVAKWAIWIFALVAALFELGIAQEIVQALFQGIVIAIALGVGLSFGLGGQEAAARYIEKLRGEIKKD